MNHSILYLRVSRDEQVRGTSLDSQEASARDLAERVVRSVVPFETGEAPTHHRANPLLGAVVTLISPDSVGSMVVRASLSGDGVVIGEVAGG